MKIDLTLKTWISDPLIEVKTGGIMYSVVGAAADEPEKGQAAKFYSAPYAVTQVVP